MGEKKKKGSKKKLLASIDELGVDYYASAGPKNTLMVRFGDSELEAREIERQLKASAKHGELFKKGSKKPRQDALNNEIQKVYIELRKKIDNPTYKDILLALKVNKTIQEIDAEDATYTISWINDSGKEKTTSLKSLQNRLTKIKRNYSN